MGLYTRHRSGIQPSVLVGRDREWAILADLFAALRDGHGRLVLISGEAGIGKTALAEATCAARRDIPSFMGRCDEMTEMPPYGPWIELSEAFDAVSGQPPLSALFAPSASVGSQSARFVQVRDILRTVATACPFVLFLDDMQWADPGSLALLHLLARDLAAYPVLIIVTYRADALSGNPALRNLLPALVREAEPLRLTLRPLTTDAVGILVQERYAPLPQTDAARLTDYLQRHAEGNPFFIGELLHGLEEDGQLTNDGDGWGVHDLDHARVPPVLRQVIAYRVAKLGEEAGRLLAIAAVIGQDVPLSLWIAVGQTEESVLLGVIESAVAARLVDESPNGSRVRFTHALIRQTLYTGMLAARRHALHRAIAEALAATPHPDPDVVAYHFRQVDDARAAEWLIRAGDRASQTFAYQTATARFTDALAMIGDDADTAHAVTRCELLIRLARLLRIADTARAIQYEEEALRLARQVQDTVLHAVAQFRLGYLISAQSRDLFDQG